MDELIDEFKETLLEKFGNHILNITLFGSFAREEASEESDIDVLVVVKRRTPQLEKDIIGVSFDLLMKHRKYISVKVYSEEEFLFKSPFIETVVREGVPLYG